MSDLNVLLKIHRDGLMSNLYWNRFVAVKLLPGFNLSLTTKVFQARTDDLLLVQNKDFGNSPDQAVENVR